MELRPVLRKDKTTGCTDRPGCATLVHRCSGVEELGPRHQTRHSALGPALMPGEKVGNESPSSLPPPEAAVERRGGKNDVSLTRP